MARKQVVHTVPLDAMRGDEPDRDAGKSYLLTEMPARQAEEWAGRALIAMAGETGGGNMAQLASMGTGALAGVSAGELRWLMDEMLTCVEVLPDGAKRDPVTHQLIGRRLIDSDIEEITTLLMLRGRLVDLHTGFSVTAILSRLGREAMTRLSDTPTSPPLSVPPSEAD